MNAKRVLPILFLVVLFLLMGCNSSTLTDDEYSFTLVDDMNREVVITGRPNRIISLAPSNTEIIYALGLGEKVVGVDNYSDYPLETENISKVGGFADPSIEKIVSLSPDLVFAANAHEQSIKQLEEMGVNVLVLNAKSIEGIYGNIELVGKAMGVQNEAVALIEDMRERIGSINDKLKDIPMSERVWAYYEVYSDPLMTVGPATFINEILETAGGRNIAYDAVTDYPKISAEVIVDRNPEVIIFPAFHGTSSFTVEKVTSRDGWQSVNAVNSGRVYGIDANIISRAGPRVAEAVEVLAKMMYPDVFEQ